MCPTYFNRGGDIYLYDNGQLSYITSGPNGSQYIDIAVLGTKLYARNFSGLLHEFDITATGLNYVQPINNFIGAGTCLGADDTYLYMDIGSQVIKADLSTLSQTVVVNSIPPTQGDIIVLSDGSLLISVMDSGVSKLHKYKNGTLINQYTLGVNDVFGVFFDGTTTYLLLSNGKIYAYDFTTQTAVLESSPVAPGPAANGGTWNGAAQAFGCDFVPFEPDPIDTDGGGTAPTPIPSTPATPITNCPSCGEEDCVVVIEQAPASSMYRHPYNSYCGCNTTELLSLIEWYEYRQAYHELNNLRFGMSQLVRYEEVEDLKNYKELLYRMSNGKVFDTPFRTLQSRIKTLLRK